MIKEEELIVLDFETYYAKDYSLSLRRYNTSSYVRDSQFLIHGVGIKEGLAPAYWVRGHDEALAELGRIGIQRRPIVAHNTAFDGFILHEHAHVHPAFYCDTLSMARATTGHHIRHNLDDLCQVLGLPGKTEGLADTKGKRSLTDEEAARLGAYCINDVERCYDVFWKLYPYIPDDEMKLIDLTMRMFCEPVLLVNEQSVERVYVQEQQDKKKLVSRAGTEAERLSSNPKFAELLRELGVDPPTKISPRTGKTTYAFAKSDPGFQELFAHEDEAVRFVAEARVRVKSTIQETRAARLLEAGRDGQKLPVLLNYAGAHTFRWSGGNKINLQNLPRGGALRRAILAPEGYVLLVHDLSQIEARLCAWFCGQVDVVHAFAAHDRGEGASVYRLMAAKVYNKPVEDVTDMERFLGKVCVLGLGYGMGWRKLKYTLSLGFAGPPMEISEGEAQRIVQSYRAANPYIVTMWSKLSQILKQMAVNENFDLEIGPCRFRYKMVELPNGLALKYPGLRIDVTDDSWGESTTYLTRRGRSKIYGGLLLENIIQALARCVIGEQMLSVGERYKVATMTHDEIVSLAPVGEARGAWEQVSQIMGKPPVWAPSLPLACSGGFDVCYSK